MHLTTKDCLFYTKLLLFWGLSYCSLSGAIEFSAGKYTVRDYEIYSELELLSKKGDLSGGIVYQIQDETGVKAPPLYRGTVSVFEILSDKEAPALRLKLLPGKSPARMELPEPQWKHVVFDFKSKKITKNAFEKTDSKAFFSKRFEEKSVRTVKVREILCFGTPFAYSSNLRLSWFEFVSACDFFTLESNINGVKCSIAFDKSEKQEFDFIRNYLNRDVPFPRMLQSWDEAPGQDELLLELRRVMWKDTRRVFRFAIKKSGIPNALKQKYPHLAD